MSLHASSNMYKVLDPCPSNFWRLTECLADGTLKCFRTALKNCGYIQRVCGVDAQYVQSDVTMLATETRRIQAAPLAIYVVDGSIVTNFGQNQQFSPAHQGLMLILIALVSVYPHGIRTLL